MSWDSSVLSLYYSIVHLGCKVNRVESDTCAALMESQGWKASKLETANLIVVNTCTVTAEADKKTRKAVRHALSRNEHAKVIVTGCAAAMAPEVFTNMSERVQVVSKAGLYDAVEKYVNKEAKAATSPTLLPIGKSFRTRVGVKIQDGCNNACTYCIVHVARGKSTSVPAKQVIAQCRALHEAGVREIVLTGINLGCYCDPEGEYLTLAALLEALLDETSCTVAHSAQQASWQLAPTEEDCLREESDEPIWHVSQPRFRIGSIEPCDVTPELIDLMAKAQGRIARHLHVPLQSGSTKVLKEMARPYTAEDFENLVARMRAVMPELALSTDVIVGFPGETEEDFAETIAVCKRSRFMKMHVFPYSLREGTPAAKRVDQIPSEIKQERAATLRRLSDTLAQEDFAHRKGKTELVLVEPNGKGTTESYHEVSVPNEVPVGTLIPMILSKMVR